MTTGNIRRLPFKKIPMGHIKESVVSNQLRVFGCAIPGNPRICLTCGRIVSKAKIQNHSTFRSYHRKV
jgi:hypothetical protein